MSEQTARARASRKTLTPPEARLWKQLKTLRKDGFHFRRQAPLLGYQLDFVCFSRLLIVEIDGRSHATADRPAHDARRDAILDREGFQTLRFTNEDVRDDLDMVMTSITHALKRSPSPSWGGTAQLSEARVGDESAHSNPTRSLRDHPPHEGEGE